jgi:hypothetical protein
VNELEKLLLREEAGDAEPRLCLRSSARIDAGRWWRGTPVWLCVVGDELLMLAVARRRYVARIAIRDCPDSHYNHETGELIIEPGDALRFNRFRITPRDAVLILKILNPGSVCRTLQNR